MQAGLNVIIEVLQMRSESELFIFHGEDPGVAKVKLQWDKCKHAFLKSFSPKELSGMGRKLKAFSCLSVAVEKN